MRIAHLFFEVPPDQRNEALEALLGEAPGVREMPGCLAFVPFLDPADPGKLGVVHEWESGADFDAYLGSAHFAAMNRLLRPMMVGAPVSRRFDAVPVQTVN